MDGTTVAVVIAGYLLGSVDFGVVVPRLLGIDIYSKGSGNPGASNVLRSIGRGTAVVVVLGDLGKAVAAAALGDLVVGEAVGFAAGAAAVVGHCFPVWHGLRGGKGVSTAAGMTFWLEPLLGLAMLVTWSGLVATTKRASVASLVVVAGYIPALVAFGHRGWSLVWGAAMAGLVTVRHYGNIKRLLSGVEHTVESESP
ncbi:MAG: glycerol-3-phosphate acyltransferase [Acidobacteria bacterium]|nr:glycerol-3-phosphate acyltransferase [Acidobacteriota bacterium]